MNTKSTARLVRSPRRNEAIRAMVEDLCTPIERMINHQLPRELKAEIYAGIEAEFYQ